MEPVKQAKNRVNGKFAPGFSGNPNGRPKKKGSFIEVFERMWDEEIPGKKGITYKEAIAKNMLNKFMGRWNKQTIIILKDMLDRMYGKPKESVELSGSNDKPVKIKVVYDNGDEG